MKKKYKLINIKYKELCFDQNNVISKIKDLENKFNLLKTEIEIINNNHITEKKNIDNEYNNATSKIKDLENKCNLLKTEIEIINNNHITEKKNIDNEYKSLQFKLNKCSEEYKNKSKNYIKIKNNLKLINEEIKGIINNKNNEINTFKSRCEMLENKLEEYYSLVNNMKCTVINHLNSIQITPINNYNLLDI